MDLILWRHAEAHDARDGQSDLDRELTSKGERQAQRVARWLNRQLPDSAKLLASPALRCQQTVKVLERRFRIVDALAPDAGADALLQAAGWPEARSPVLVVGHQPALGQVAAMLMCGQAQDWALRKGGLIWLRGRLREGRQQVVLQAAFAPELL